ncbi:MAG: translocation/assembly module TamB domain-containing protein [Balneolaceae bacterium]
MRWLLALLITVVLLGGVRLALKSDWLFDTARNLITERVNEQINGTLTIGSMRGDLLYGFTIRDIHLSGPDGQPVFSADSVQARYLAWSFIRQPYHLDFLHAGGVEVHLRQISDSLWNVQELLPAFGVEEPEGGEPPFYWMLDQLQLSQADIYIESAMLPDGFLDIMGLHADLQAGVMPAGWLAELNSLEFSIREGRLPQPLTISAQAGAEQMGETGRITLESLVIQTGRSMLRAQGDAELDADVTAGSDLSPLSWQDVHAYAEGLPLVQDLNLSLRAAGRFDDLNLGLTVQATGLEQAVADVNISLINGTPVFREISASVAGFDGPLLTGVEEMPQFSRFELTGSGQVSVGEPKQAQWGGQMALEGLRYDAYGLDRLQVSTVLGNERAQIAGTITNAGEEISLNADASSIFDGRPQWELQASSSALNLANWLNDESLDSQLSVSILLEGEGIEPDDFLARYRLAVDGGRWGDQPFGRIEATGEADAVTLSTELQAWIDRSRLQAEAQVESWQQVPAYQFSVRLLEFNSAELTGLEDFPTYINALFEGEGTGIDPETMRVSAVARLDSSRVNREPIETMRADLRLQDAILYVEDAVLSSPIADGSFSMRQHILDLRDSENRIDFSVDIKNPFALAPLAGVESLRAEGNLNGELRRNEQGTLAFRAGARLQEVFVDTLFQSSEITGSISVLLEENPQVDAQLELIEPVFAGAGVQDISTRVQAVLTGDDLDGFVELSIINDVESRLDHSGSFRFSDGEWELFTESLDFDTPLRLLSLRQPFTLTLRDDVVRVDSFRVQTEENDAFLSFWAPTLSADEQEAGMEAVNLNIGVLQRTLIDNSFLDAILSGRIEFRNNSEELYLSATGLLAQIQAEEGTMDSLRFSAIIQDEWLDAGVAGWHQGQLLVEGAGKIPFIPGDPITFDDQFFDRAIVGSFELNESDISYWTAFLPPGTVPEAEGTLSLRAFVDGVAGVPEFGGQLKLLNGRLSGVPVDSLGVGFSYLHENERIHLTGDLLSNRQQILDFDASLPLKIDLRQLELLLPDDDDEVEVELRTNNFSLALLNDFVDPELVRQLSGTLNGRVVITGTVADPEPNGTLTLSRGSMRVVPAGITISEINSALHLQPGLVTLQQFSMRSGPGRINATGSVQVENLQAGVFDLQMRGNQFRAVNTSQMNAVIDLNAQLAGTFDEPMLTGSLTVLNGVVNLQNFGAQDLEEVVLEDEETPEPIAFYDHLAMEFDLRFTRNFIIRNRQFIDLEIELGGGVDLVKEKGRDLQMFGTVEGTRGFARPLGRNFQIDEAFVTFVGPVDDPELNVRTKFEPPQAQSNVTIFYIIEGTGQNPEFRFDSEPQMELQDIISYTVFGRPFYELESWEQVVAGGGGTSASDVALDILLDRFEILATQRLGIDVVQIDTDRSGARSATSVLTGWYLNRRTFFAILNEVSADPKTLFLLEYMLTNNLEISVTQGDDSREGIDLRWRHEY